MSIHNRERRKEKKNENGQWQQRLYCRGGKIVRKKTQKKTKDQMDVRKISTTDRKEKKKSGKEKRREGQETS